ncbi:MAG TPA: tetratricopeptide repeat protein [Myxococcota bacterium]|nr:tetratricopeptide repeat protein [Myxococcota bacterium]
MKTDICPNPSCGNEIPADAVTCPICGTDISLAKIEYCTARIKQNPKDVDAFLYRASAYVVRDELDRAIADLNYAIKLDPSNAEAYSLRGTALVEKEDYQGAVFDLNHAIKLKPDGADFYFYRGLAYRGLEDAKSALADFNQVLRMNPNNSDAYMQRAIIFESQGKLGKAIADMKKALEVTTDPYQRTTIENLLREEKQFQSKGRQRQAGGCLMALLQGLWEMVVSIFRAVLKG